MTHGARVRVSSVINLVMYFESKRLDVDSPAKKINQFVESTKFDERTFALEKKIASLFGQTCFLPTKTSSSLKRFD